MSYPKDVLEIKRNLLKESSTPSSNADNFNSYITISQK